MKQINMTYAQADAAFYEAMRINRGKSEEWSKLKEGNALINTDKTKMNYELRPHHPALNPSNYLRHNRGAGIAAYHNEITGRAARMKGDDKQRSKAVGAIITLPKDYIDRKIELTDEEYLAIERYLS